MKTTITQKKPLSGRSYLKKRLKDPDFKKVYDAEKLRADIARAFKARRKEMKYTQLQLAEKAQTHQKIISRIENAETSVGVDLLYQVAIALESKIKFSFEAL